MCAGVPYRSSEIVPAPRQEPRRLQQLKQSIRRLAATPVSAWPAVAFAAGALAVVVHKLIPLLEPRAWEKAAPEVWAPSYRYEDVPWFGIALLAVIVPVVTALVLLQREASAGLEQPQISSAPSPRMDFEWVAWLRISLESGLSELQALDALQRGTHRVHAPTLNRIRDAVLDDMPLLRAIGTFRLVSPHVAERLHRARWRRDAQDILDKLHDELRTPRCSPSLLVEAVESLRRRPQVLYAALLLLPILGGLVIAAR